MSEEDRAALGSAVARMGELAAEGRLTEGVRAFAGFVFDDEEIAIAEEAGYFDASARYVPDLLDFFRQLRDYHGPTHEDPAVLSAISAPALVPVGSDTKPYCTAYAQHVAEHAPNARIHEIPGVGHAAPLTNPEALAEPLTEFFWQAQPT